MCGRPLPQYEQKDQCSGFYHVVYISVGFLLPLKSLNVRVMLTEH